MQKTKQATNGDRCQETEQVVARGLGGEETQGAAEKHDAFDANVNYSGTLVDQLAEAGEAENH